jgi:hypothetical protein
MRAPGGILSPAGMSTQRPRAVEAPVMIGAADLSVDHLAHRQIGAQVRAERALHQGLAARVPVEDDAGAQEVPAHDLPAPHLTGQGQGEPGLVEAGRLVVLLRQGLGRAHRRLLRLAHG